MSFAKPEYVKMFISKKLKKDEESLIDDDALSQSSQQETSVSIPSQGAKRDHGSLSSKTPLHSMTTAKYGYGTSQEGEFQYFPKSIEDLHDNGSNKGKSNKLYYQQNNGSNESLDYRGSDNDKEHKDSGDDIFNSSYHNHGHFEPHYNHAYSSDLSDSETESDHCHEDSVAKEKEDQRKRKKAMQKLICATVLSFVFMVGEIVGGYLANSLAIMTDASHLLTDVSSFLVSIIALQMAAKPSSKNMTFGWHRAEVVGAITSVLAIWVVTGVLVYLAVLRLIRKDYELDGRTMLITAACAVGFNIIMGVVLHESGHGHAHGHSHAHSHGGNEGHDSHRHDDCEKQGDEKRKDNEESGNVNVRAAFIHVLGDLLQSLGVLVAAFIIYFKPEYKIADPICTFIFSALVLATTIAILRDTMVIIMEGTPAGINYEKVKETILSIRGVVAVHDLRIWSLTLNQCVMSCHVAIDKNAKPGTILKQTTRKLKSMYNFHSMTIQVENYSMDMDGCKKCKRE